MKKDFTINRLSSYEIGCLYKWIMSLGDIPEVIIDSQFNLCEDKYRLYLNLENGDQVEIKIGDVLSKEDGHYFIIV